MIDFSSTARERIHDFISQEEDSELAVRISVISASPLAPEYEMALVTPEEIGGEDRVFDSGGVRVAVAAESVDLLEGTHIDWIESIEGGGFKFENPNIAPLGEEPLTGPMAERVQRVIDEQVNPAIAGHGGQVGLVDIRDDVVYLTMSGGCQGCGMASVTLRQGIERMLRERIPEIAGVEDVTNHAAGTNPYY